MFATFLTIIGVIIAVVFIAIIWFVCSTAHQINKEVAAEYEEAYRRYQQRNPKEEGIS